MVSRVLCRGISDYASDEKAKKGYSNLISIKVDEADVVQQTSTEQDWARISLFRSNTG